ncbi:hypothetical protein [Methylobacterium ajmalii]|uniref:hypothetical protein n=1 Tax=Methylobacterium ajmalii TaxID=2738439 RepID=UPI00190A6F03|nr:hypothetical protein [Methylobacterium ajmalii]MBK3398069.1 hypothetical protein [Methylobacterium ajmalii]MBK3406899.1 hypothetical protein [Methylobacterium ajmalii]MBK3424538.1 hypothetical protein [Methylobacterium ajmalii]MBZ6416499.1 hypothetical protein [Methylobacterium sp.]
MTRLGFPFQGHHERREAEWVGALVLLGVAAALLSPGPTFSRPTFDPFAAVAPEGTWGAALMGIAVVRMVGLWVNGSKRHSPLLRFVTAAVGAAMWGWITVLLWHDGYPGVNTGCGAYGVLCLVDGYCAFRAIWDQGRNDQRAANIRRATA